MSSFKLFVDSYFPELSEHEREVMAMAIYTWFYGVAKK